MQVSDQKQAYVRYVLVFSYPSPFQVELHDVIMLARAWFNLVVGRLHIFSTTMSTLVSSVTDMAPTKQDMTSQPVPVFGDTLALQDTPPQQSPEHNRQPDSDQSEVPGPSNLDNIFAEPAEPNEPIQDWLTPSGLENACLGLSQKNSGRH